MRHTMSFQYPDDEYAHKAALIATDMASAYSDISNYIRGILKHTDPTPEVREHLEHIRSLIPDKVSDL